MGLLARNACMNSQGIVQLLKLSVSLAARLPPLVFETPDVKSLHRKGLQLPSSSPHTAGRCIAQSYVPDQGATGPRPGGHAEADRDRRSQDRRLRALLGDAAAQQSASGAALKRSEWMQPNHAAKKGDACRQAPRTHVRIQIKRMVRGESGPHRARGVGTSYRFEPCPPSAKLHLSRESSSDLGPVRNRSEATVP